MSDPAVERFEVLIVCTGNVCRSPVAEQVLRARFGERFARFSSAGTFALVGEQMPEPAQMVARRLGAEPGALHAPRRLDESLVARADLVLALTREHRADVVRMLPRANRYAVTLREAARLLESLAAEVDEGDRERLRAMPLPNALRALVPMVMAERGAAPRPRAAEDDDVVDPYRRSQEVYDESGRQIATALDGIERGLRLLAGIG